MLQENESREERKSVAFMSTVLKDRELKYSLKTRPAQRLLLTHFRHYILYFCPYCCLPLHPSYQDDVQSARAEREVGRSLSGKSLIWTWMKSWGKRQDYNRCWCPSPPCDSILAGVGVLSKANHISRPLVYWCTPVFGSPFISSKLYPKAEDSNEKARRYRLLEYF